MVIYIYEGLFCVNCEEYKAIFAFELINVDVATLSIFNFPYLFIIFFLFTYFWISDGVIPLSIVENLIKSECLIYLFFIFFFCGC